MTGKRRRFEIRSGPIVIFGTARNRIGSGSSGSSGSSGIGGLVIAPSGRGQHPLAAPAAPGVPAAALVTAGPPTAVQSRGIGGPVLPSGPLQSGIAVRLHFHGKCIHGRQ